MKNPLVALREKAGITSRRELSRRINLSYEILSHYETGMRPKMTDRAVKEFSKALNADPEQLKGDYAQWKQSLLTPA